MSLFLDALDCKNTSGQIPVWFMRQAGRYLPEYQAIRQKHTLESLFHNTEAIIEIAKQPLTRFAVDACVIFSDILLPTEVLGIEWSYPEGIGPTPSMRISSPEDIDKLHLSNDPTAFDYLAKAIHELSHTITQPIIGLIGGPFTVASYLIEKKHTSHLSVTKSFAYKHPGAFSKLLDMLTEAMIIYGHKQVQAGAKALQFFDSWAGLLDPHDYRSYSLSTYQKITRAFPDIPCIYFSRGSGQYAHILAEVNPRAVSIDWAACLKTIRKTLPLPVTLQGNLDPARLLGPASSLTQHARAIVAKMQDDRAFIFNLGHGILPQTNPDNVHRLIDCVRESALV